MKNEQHEQAKEFYFQTNLSKSEIAEKVGVNRRTVMLWSQQGNWDKLRKSARHLPSLVAEKCYYLLDQFTSKLLIDGFGISTLSHHDADTINKLASSIKKLKNRSATNESMEMFTFFLEGLSKKNPQLAADILPEVEDYIISRKNIDTSDVMLEEFRRDGSLPYPEDEINERNQDIRDAEAFREEMRKAGDDYDQAIENWQKGESVPPSAHYQAA